MRFGKLRIPNLTKHMGTPQEREYLRSVRHRRICSKSYGRMVGPHINSRDPLYKGESEKPGCYLSIAPPNQRGDSKGKCGMVARK
jgi:hypothetical protein